MPRLLTEVPRLVTHGPISFDKDSFYSCGSCDSSHCNLFCEERNAPVLLLSKRKSQSSDMNAYEQAREDRIKRNNAMLAQLEVCMYPAAEPFCISITSHLLLKSHLYPFS